MKRIPVNLKLNPHNIIVGPNILSGLGAYLKKIRIGQDALIITSAPIKRLHGRTLAASLTKNGFTVKFFLVPDGEKSKSASEAMRLLERIAVYDVYKKPFIVAFGGGVVGDLAGFVSAVYKRGIPYIQVPTTFLAQIDSAIGGKTAIDLSVGKNLAGAFYHPKVIWSDVSLLKTLSQRQMRNGLAEAVKYGIIRDRNLFFYLKKNFQKVIGRNTVVLAYVVEKCSRIKVDVVLADEKETKGIRSILNFGHTVGHAIEAVGGFNQYQHGEAIALGMRVAADLSYRLGVLNMKDKQEINSLLSQIGLPQRISSRIKINRILSLMKHDKKFVSGKNKFVLALGIGKVVLREGIPEGEIRKAINSCY